MDLFEDPGEVVGVVETDGQPGGFDRDFRLLQQSRGVLHAQARKKLRGCLSGVLAEKTGKILRSDATSAGRSTRTAQDGVIRHEVFAAAVEGAAAPGGQAGWGFWLRPDPDQESFKDGGGDFALLLVRQA